MNRASRTPFQLLVLTILSLQAHAETAESIFAEASRFTVRIDATITRAFIEDEVGAHHGAGFIVDESRRWVMTNAHVVGHSPARLTVEFSDGTKSDAHKVYVDPYIDVAIIQMETTSPSIHEAPLGCNQRVGVGHPVGAFGHPWGLNFTGTRGVISGSTNKFGAELLQTDAPINGGNSGGPLISMASGKVVGVSSSSINSDDDQNTNFGVPIEQACQILELLLTGQDPSPPQMDVTFYMLTGDNGPLIVARSYLTKDLIQIQSEDEVISANGFAVSNESDLINALRGSLESAQLTIKRKDKLIEVHGRLDPTPFIIERQGLLFAGMLFAEGRFRDRAILETGHDVMIHSIVPGSQADGSKVSFYDYVSAVDGNQVRSLAHLRDLLQDIDKGSAVQLDFLRFMEDGSTGHLFYSLRRRFSKESSPIEIGLW